MVSFNQGLILFDSPRHLSKRGGDNHKLERQNRDFHEITTISFIAFSFWGAKISRRVTVHHRHRNFKEFLSRSYSPPVQTLCKNTRPYKRQLVKDPQRKRAE